MMLAQPKAVASAEALLFTGGFLHDESQRPIWVYRDHQGKLQGPFTAANMVQWYSTGRLPQDLLVCGVSQPTAPQALEAVPVSCFRPLNQLIASVAQGMQYQPITIAARQPAPMQLMQGGLPPQTQMMRPMNPQGPMQLQQLNMMAAQAGQAPMALPSAVRPAAPQLQQAFRPNMGVQQLVQLQQPQPQQPNMVMLQQQQQQPQQMLLTSQQQAAPALQPMMLMQQQQPHQVVLQPQGLTGPRPQMAPGQPQVMLQQARMAAPQQGPSGAILQQLPQQPGMQLQPTQQQQPGLVRPAGVPPGGVGMPVGAGIAMRPGQPMILQPMQQAGAVAANAVQPAAVANLQPPVQILQANAAPGAAHDAAAAHVAQRLEHLAAQAQAVRTPAGPVPPLVVDKTGAPLSSGPPSRSPQHPAGGPMGPSSTGGLQLPAAARSASNSFNNLDLLVRQANAAVAVSGPPSAGAPAGLLPGIRTTAERRSSAGTGLPPLTPRGPSTAGVTPTGYTAAPGSTVPSLRSEEPSVDATIDDMLFDLVEDVAVDAGEGPRAAKQQHHAAKAPTPKAPTPTAFLVGPKSAGASAGSSPLPHMQQQQRAGSSSQIPASGMTAAGPGVQQQQQGMWPVARQLPGGPTAGGVVKAGPGGLMSGALPGVIPQQQHQQLVGQPQQVSQHQHLLRQQQLLQQQHQQQLLQQQQVQQQQQQAQQQQQQLLQQQAQQQQQQAVLLAQRQQQQLHVQHAVPGAAVTLEELQQRQQHLTDTAMKQLHAGRDASAALEALQQLMQQQQQLQQQQQQVAVAAAAPAAQPLNPPPGQSSLPGLVSAAGTAAGSHDGGAGKAAPASSQPAAPTSAAPAEPSTREFNPWGMSFMDPTSIVAEVAKAEPQQPKQQPAQAAAGGAVATATAGQQQQAPGGGPGQAGLSEDELLAALMPELESTGLSADQKLALLKQMLGMQQQKEPPAGAGPTQAGMQQQQQPQLPRQASASPVPPPPQQQQGQSNALQQLFQHATQSMPGQDKQQQQPAAQKPQHVWLQQLANNSKATGGGDAAAAAGGKADGAAGHGTKGVGSDAGDEFDSSMLPADLFDFLDGHSSPTRKTEETQTGNGKVDISWWSHAQQHDQQDQQAGSADGHDSHGMPHKYVPPGRRPSGEWGTASTPAAPRSSSGNGAVPPPPPPPPSWTARERERDAASRSGSTYVPPHARERGSSPPPGYGRERLSGGSSTGSGGYSSYSDREREQRIAAQQQMLPPHLRIVPSDSGEDGAARSEGGASWPPPPPPHSSQQGSWDEGPISRRPSYPREGPGAAGEEEGKGNKLRRLFEAAAVTAAGPAGLPRQPPPPPPGAPRHQPHWDGPGSSHQPQRVPPGFESEFPEGPVPRGGPAGREWDWEREQGPDSYSSRPYAGRSAEGAGGEHGEYPRRSGWVAGRGGYEDEWEGGELRGRGRGPPAAADRWQMEEDWDGRDRLVRGTSGKYSDRQYSSAYPSSATYDADYEDRGSSRRYHDEYDEAGRQQFPPPPRQPLRGSPRARGAPPAPPPRSTRGEYDTWGDDSDPHYPAHGASGCPLRQPAPPPPREGRSGASSRQDRGDMGSSGDPRSLTWQQEQMLHDFDEGEAVAGPATGGGRSGWQGASDYWDDHGDMRPQERERHRSPDPSSRHGIPYGSPPTGSAPQPSQHLRAAAHNLAGRRGPAPPKPGSGGSTAPPVDMQARYQEDFPVLGNSGARNGSSSKGYADAVTGGESGTLDSKESASAAALAAVAGLKPSVTVAPPRSSVTKARKQGSEGYSGSGPHLPSVEETKAAVMAALGIGPVLDRNPSGGGSGSSGTALQDAVQQHAQDSRHGGVESEGPASLRKGSGSSSGGGEAPAPAAGTVPPPSRRIAATGLFGNVIGQLRRQSNARDNPDAQDGDEGFGSADGDDAPSSRGSYLSAASGRARRGAGGVDAAEIVLAVINTTRQRASKLSGRSRHAEQADVGKADAAWQETPDTANSCDSSCGSAQPEAS